MLPNIYKEKLCVELQNTLNSLSEAVYISDLETYELVYMNEAAKKHFGVPAPGAKCYTHLYGKAAPCDFCTNKLLLQCEGHRHSWMRYLSNGKCLLLHDSVIEYNGRSCHMEIASNVNPYLSQLSDAQANLAMEKRLVSCMENLVMTNDFSAAIHAMLQNIIDYYKADRSYVFELDREHNTTRNTYEVCRDGVPPMIHQPNSFPMDVLVERFLHQQLKSTIINDVEALKNDPSRSIAYHSLHKRGVRNLVIVPVFIAGDLYGFLGVDNPHAHTDAPELLMQVSYIAANEIHRRRMVQKLADKSYHDPLTGLRNRVAYDEVLEHLLGKEFPTGVGFLDINRLKWVNDNMGYDMGNKVVCRLCAILTEHFQKEQIYRISGDEFVIIWPHVEYAAFTQAAQKLRAALFAEDHIAAFGYVWGREEDIGISVRKAEKAMQTAKKKFYALNDLRRSARPSYLNSFLQQFLGGTFVPYLQPLYNLKTNRVYGAEVLVRQIDTDGSIHTPVEFIDMMEHQHLISLVDFQMLRKACVLMQKWKPQWPQLIINTNFSRHTLAEPDFLERLDKILAETGADPSRLLFEITESSHGIQLESLCDLFDALRKRNILLGIDDFGTEASCFEMLYLPQISVVKIDRGMICRAEQNPREQLIIRRLIALCHDLHMRCIAEGIETDSQMQLLKTLGCDRLQGYKIGKPMPAEEFFARYAPLSAPAAENAAAKAPPHSSDP